MSANLGGIAPSFARAAKRMRGAIARGLRPGSSIPEPIGDRAGHNLPSVRFSCIGVGGLLKGAVLTGNAMVEWDGAKSDRERSDQAGTIVMRPH